MDHAFGISFLDGLLERQISETRLFQHWLKSHVCNPKQSLQEEMWAAIEVKENLFVPSVMCEGLDSKWTD